MSSEPARIVNKNDDWLGTLRPGYRADVTLFDPDLEWVVDTSKFLSKSTNTPFNDCRLKGKVLLTIVNGNIVYQDEAISSAITQYN